GRRRLGRIFLGRAAPGSEQRDVPSGEVEMLDVLALEHLAGVAEFDLGADRARTRHRRDLVARELAFGEDLHHLASDVAGRADDCHPIPHLSLLAWCAGLSAQRLARNRKYP